MHVSELLISRGRSVVSRRQPNTRGLPIAAAWLLSTHFTHVARPTPRHARQCHRTGRRGRTGHLVELHRTSAHHALLAPWGLAGPDRRTAWPAAALGRQLRGKPMRMAPRPAPVLLTCRRRRRPRAAASTQRPRRGFAMAAREPWGRGGSALVRHRRHRRRIHDRTLSDFLTPATLAPSILPAAGSPQRE